MGGAATSPKPTDCTYHKSMSGYHCNEQVQQGLHDYKGSKTYKTIGNIAQPKALLSCFKLNLAHDMLYKICSHASKSWDMDPGIWQVDPKKWAHPNSVHFLDPAVVVEHHNSGQQHPL